MKTLNRQNFPGPQYPTRAIQFGEGNFLRAFIDWQLDLLNEKTDLATGVTIVRPINTVFPPSLNTQDGLYTTVIRGLNERGEAVSEARIIRSVNNEINPWQDFAGYLALARDPEIAFVFSNTTEAGISYHAGDRPDDMPPVSFPAKLTQLLLERFRHFNGAADKGWTIIPCELIDYNGEALKALVLRYAKEWQLPTAFSDWVETANTFCSTLVDRIVTGYPREEAEKLEAELGYHDAFLDTAEYFWLFVIQGPQGLAEMLRLDRCPLNIRIVEDIRPYKARQHGAIPPRLTFALAALIAFYRGQRDGQTYPLQDDEVWLTRFAEGWAQVANGSPLHELVTEVLQDAAHWGEDLRAIPGLADQVTRYLEMILRAGMREALSRL